MTYEELVSQAIAKLEAVITRAETTMAQLDSKIAAFASSMNSAKPETKPEQKPQGGQKPGKVGVLC